MSAPIRLAPSKSSFYDQHPTEESEKSPLHAAARNGDWHLAHDLLKKGADPNALDANLATPLHDACLHADWPMIDLLNTYGARRNVRELDGFQPMNIIYSIGKGDEFLLDEYDKRANQALVLIHALDFSASAKVDGTSIFLRGALPKAMMPHLTTIFRDIRAGENNLNKASLQKIEKAFRYGFDGVYSNQSLLRKINSGELIFLYAGWQGHAVGICFYNGYMAVCNRGKKSDEIGTVVVFAIDVSKMTEKILDRIQNVISNFSADAGAKVLYKEVPLWKLNGKRCPKLELGIGLQKEKTCGFASLKAAALFAYRILNLDRRLNHDETETELKLLSKLIKKAAWIRNWMKGLQEDPTFEVSQKIRRYLDRKFPMESALPI